MTDYRLVSKIQNNRIMSLVELYGYKNVTDFCRDNDLNRCTVGDVINMKLRPLTKRGEYRKVVEDMASALRVHPDTLFTESQRELELERNVAETTFGERRFLELTDGNPETLLLESEADCELIGGVRDTLDRLTPREHRIIDSLYGLDNNGVKQSLVEVGAEEGISPERVRQIEAKSFRKLRNKFRANDVFEHYTG